MNEPTPPQSTGDRAQDPLDPGVVTTEPRPPLVRSTVYVLRALIGLALVLFGKLLLLIFESALLGIREDLATIQEAWLSG